MKTRAQALKYGLSFPDTYQDAPFHDDNWQLVRYKGNDKAFLWTYEADGVMCLNLKADPDKIFLSANCILLSNRDIIRIKSTGLP